MTFTNIRQSVDLAEPSRTDGLRSVLLVEGHSVRGFAPGNAATQFTAWADSKKGHNTWKKFAENLCACFFSTTH